MQASERRANELASLCTALNSAGLVYTVVDSPFTAGYAASNIKLFLIEPYVGSERTADVLAEIVQPSVSRDAASGGRSSAGNGREQALDAARAAERANQESIARIAAGAIRTKCDVNGAVAGRCVP